MRFGDHKQPQGFAGRMFDWWVPSQFFLTVADNLVGNKLGLDENERWQTLLKAVYVTQRHSRDDSRPTMVNMWQTMCYQGDWKGQPFDYWFARPNPEIFKAVDILTGDGTLMPGQDPRNMLGKAFIPVSDERKGQNTYT